MILDEVVCSVISDSFILLRLEKEFRKSIFLFLESLGLRCLFEAGLDRDSIKGPARVQQPNVYLEPKWLR